MSDQFKISPHNINTISSRRVMGIKKYISHGIISWSKTKFSEIIGDQWESMADIKEMY